MLNCRPKIIVYQKIWDRVCIDTRSYTYRISYRIDTRVYIGTRYKIHDTRRFFVSCSELWNEYYMSIII